MHETTQKHNDYVAELELLLDKTRAKRDDWRARAIRAEGAVEDTKSDAIVTVVVDRMRAEVERLTADNDYLHEMVRKLVEGDG